MENLKGYRDCTIDNIKGVGILLVVLGHLSLPEDIRMWIYSFHMPLFTFISGVFIKKYSTANLWSKINRLLVPFFFYSFLSWMGYTLLVYIYHPELLIKQLWKGVYMLAGSGQNAISLYGNGNITMWFLSFLFVVCCFYWFFDRFKIQVIGVGCMMSLAYFSAIFHMNLPANLDTVFLLFPFFYLGTFYKNLHSVWLSVSSRKYLLILLPFLFICQFYISKKNGHVDTSSNNWGSHICYFYLAALLGVFNILLLFAFSRRKVFSFWGKNSIYYLILNIPLINISNWILNYFNIQKGIESILFSFVFVVISVIPLAYIIKNYFPKSIGIKSFFSTCK